MLWACLAAMAVAGKELHTVTILIITTYESG